MPLPRVRLIIDSKLNYDEKVLPINNLFKNLPDTFVRRKNNDKINITTRLICRLNFKTYFSSNNRRYVFLFYQNAEPDHS